MTSSRLPNYIVGLLTLTFGILAFSVNEAWSSHALTEEKTSTLIEANALLAKYPQLKPGHVPLAQSKGLKTLVGDAGIKHNVRINYITEIDKELDSGVREVSVVCRIADVDTKGLINMASDIETPATGAFVKEVRLKPSTEKNAVFQDAELVFAARLISR